MASQRSAPAQLPSRVLRRTGLVARNKRAHARRSAVRACFAQLVAVARVIATNSPAIDLSACCGVQNLPTRHGCLAHQQVGKHKRTASRIMALPSSRHCNRLRLPAMQKCGQNPVCSNANGPVSEAHRGRFPLLTQEPARIAACRVTYADSSWGLACLERPPLLPIRDIWSRSRLTAWPPFRPASRASSLVNSCALPLACAALPPLLANKRRFSGSNAAKPRRLRVAFCPSSTVPPLDASMTTSLGIGGTATIVPTLKPTHSGVATTNAGKNGCARCAKVAHLLHAARPQRDSATTHAPIRTAQSRVISCARTISCSWRKRCSNSAR